MTYRDMYQTRQTLQTEPVPGKPQVPNSAGGFVFAVDDWTRLDRFLILGSSAPTYYASAKKLTVENAEAVRSCIAADGIRVVERIVEISNEGRAPSNDPALFALAMCAGLGDKLTRSIALSALPFVARTGTHLFHFAEYIEGFRGWGRGLRRGIANWYNSKHAASLAYQLVKYQQRDGWGHRDLLRLSHPQPASPEHNLLFNWAVGKATPEDTFKLATTSDIILLGAYERAKAAASAAELVRLIRDYGLTREMVPTEFLNDTAVWEALLEDMPLTAMLRNLGKMTAIGLLKPLSQAAGTVAARLHEGEYIRKSRLHPLAILVALRTYAKGSGVRGSLSWEPVAQIVDALDAAFYLSFGNVEPTGKRTMIALDVSGSMGWGEIAGMTGVTPRVGAAAMAMITAKTEPAHLITAFSNRIVPVALSPRQRLDDVLNVVDGIGMGSTDCAQPMIYAFENGLDIDTFVIYTDSETWYGQVHPFQALRLYREKTGIPAKLITVGMVSNGFSIADPSDGGMMDVVGFDTAAPAIMADFARG